MDYIGQLKSDQAGKLIPDAGETPAAIRRRRREAAQLLGKNLVVNRQRDAVFFWEESLAYCGFARIRAVTEFLCRLSTCRFASAGS